MSKLWHLIKISFIQNLGINKLLKSKKRLVNILMIILFIGLFVGVFAYLTYVYYQFGTLLQQAGSVSALLTIGLIFSTLTVLISSISRGNAFLFKQKDFDFLSSMPIKASHIIISKITSYLVFNYITQAFTLIPAIIAYRLLGIPVTPEFYFVLVIVFFIMPLLMIAVFTTVSYLLGMALARFKYKNLLTILGALIFFGLIYWISFASSSDPSQMNDLALSLSKLSAYIYYPAKLAEKALLGDLLSLVYLSLLTVIPFAVFIYITSKYYHQIQNKLNKSYKNRKFDASTFTFVKSTNLIFLLKREFKNYFSKASYVINTIIGPILTPVTVFFMGKSLMPVLNEAGADYSNLGFIVCLAVAFFIGSVNYPSAISISIEGNTFWILKSSPISYQKIFISKILMSFLLQVPSLIITTIIIYLFTEPALPLLLLGFLSLTLGTIFFASLSLFINLLLPKMQWTAIIKVVKQSASVIVSMLVIFAIQIAIFIFAAFIFSSLELVQLLSILFAILLLLSVVLFLLFKFLGEKLYMRLPS